MRNSCPVESGRRMLRKFLLLPIFFLLIIPLTEAQVVVTPPSSLNLCVNGDYKPLGKIRIKETSSSDFTGGNGLTYVISAPANFEFKPNLGNASTNLVGDISVIGINVSAASITVFYNGAAVAALVDSIIINGVEVRALVTASSGNLLRTGGTAVQLNNAASPVNMQNHGSLNSFAPPVVSLGSFSSVCAGASPVALTGGTPGGGTYSGTGVFGSNFYPSVSGAGTFPVTYTYADAIGCTSTATANIVVNPSPTVSLASFPVSTVCKNSAVIALPAGSPSGGSYTGTGINGSNFDPSIASTGNNTITYSYTNGNGCTNTASRSITVNGLPSVSFAPLPDRCVNAISFTLTGGSPSGGTYSGTGVSGTSFSPGTAGVGVHTLTYTYTDGNNCSNSAKSSIQVHAQPGVTFSGLDPTYCVNAGAQALTGFPAGGSFAGAGVSGNTFTPASAGVGGPYNITYNYTDTYGCSNSASSQTTILSIPSVTLTGLQNGYAVTDDYATIGGTQSPAGGTISVSGPGVSNLTSRFYPGVAGVGTHTIVRTYVGPNGCSASATKVVNVGDNSGGNVSGLSSTYCLNAPAVMIQGSPLPGEFSGPGITPIGNKTGTAIFNPAAAGIGTHLIVYWFDLNFGGTPIAIPFFSNVTVNPDPTVEAFGLKGSYCLSDPSVTLFGSPGGGTFNGPGVSGNTFNPTSAGVGSKMVTYTYTNGFGCSNSYSQFTTVNANPTGVDFSGLGTQYCEDAPNASLTGSPAGGTFSGTGISGNSFSPSLANAINGPGNYNIIYTYTNASGCSSSKTRSTVVNLKPVVSFSGFPTNASYCIDAAPVTLTGSPSGGTFSTLTSPAGTITGNIFNPGIAKVGSHPVKYIYTDGNGCTNFKLDTAIVNPLPYVDFTGLDPLYCHIAGKSISLASNQVAGPTAIFSGPGIAGSNFFPAIAGVGQHTIKFQFTDANGCYKDTSKTTTVYARPKADYTMSTLCEGDVITFTDGSTIQSTAQAPSIINGWQWQFSDGVIFGSQNPSRKFSKGSYSLSYTVTTDKGCDTTLITTFTIGPYPESKFSWKNICDQDITEFTNLSTISAGTINAHFWNFNDAGATSNNPAPAHTFSSPGIYKVSLKVTSDKNCVTTDTQRVFVLPVKNSFPYFSDFESGADGWIASSSYDPEATWALGTPVKSVINAAGSGANAWVTSLTGNHNKNEKSYVYSPCFDFSSLDRPMISMKINSATVDLNAGAVLQYSLDEGLTWNVVGTSLNDGLNWYNRSGISGQLGIQSLNQYGWTGNVTNGWKTAKHNLNNIAQVQRLRFRIAFGSDASDNLAEGFAFDDFYVGDRTKLVLVEHFTNSSTTNTNVENRYIDSVLTVNQLDAVAIAYHTSFPGPDPLNVRNSGDPSGRVLFYGVSQVPRTIIDGNFYNGNTLGVISPKIDKRALEDPAFKIDLSATAGGGMVTASAIIEAQQNISNNVTLQLAVIERSVTAVTGSNGETHFNWVLNKLMPDAAGTTFTQAWTAGATRTVSQSWSFTYGRDIYDIHQLGVIAFVQDNVTKEIYQTTYAGPGSNNAVTVTGVDNPATDLEELSVYPNPSSAEANIIFRHTLKEDISYRIVDPLGKTVLNGEARKGGEGFVVNTGSLTNGIYTIVIGSEGRSASYQKLVVSH